MENVNPAIGNTVLADVVPSTHEILTEMPMSPLYHEQCLWNPDGKGWIPIKLIHPMNDLDISFVKEGRKAIGFDIEEKYVEMGNKRTDIIKAQPSLFAGS